MNEGTERTYRILRDLGEQGILLGWLTDDEIDTIMAKAPDVSLRIAIRKQALAAIKVAQEKRDELLRSDDE